MRTIKPSDTALNAQAAAFAPLFNNGYLRIYAGLKPVDANEPVGTQVLLAELRFSNPAFAASSHGILTGNPLTPDTKAKATGTATWFRCFTEDGATSLLDGSVGTSDADMVLNSVLIQEGAEVWLPGLVYSVAG